MSNKSKSRPKKATNAKPVAQGQAKNGLFQKLMGQPAPQSEVQAEPAEANQRHPLGGYGNARLYPDEVLRQLGITQPVHPNQANRIFWRYCKDRHLIR